MKSFRDFTVQKIVNLKNDDEITESLTEKIMSNSIIVEEDNNISLTDNPDYLKDDPEIVGYYDSEQQENVYFLATKGKLSLSEKVSILDFGCGRGDLFNFLKSYGLPFDYIGIEKSESLVKVGKEKYPDVNIVNDSYHLLEIKDEYNSDWVLNIGNLNLNYGYARQSFDKYDEFVNLLDISMHFAKVGVTFVLLEDNLGNNSYIHHPIHEITKLLKERFPMYRYDISYTDIENVYILNILAETW